MGCRADRGSDLGRIILVTLLGLNFALSGLNSRSGAQGPGHEHIVVGADGLSEWAHALMSHHSGTGGLPLLAFGDPSPATSAGMVPRGHPRVFSIGRTLEPTSASVLDIDPNFLKGQNSPTTRPSTGRGGPVVALTVQRLTPCVLAVPDPPPRTAA